MTRYCLSLVVLGVVLTGCLTSCSKIHPSSNFMGRFSLDEAIKEIHTPYLKPSSGSGVSGASAGEPSPHRREFNKVFDIEESKPGIFDERAFLDKLREKIYQKARDAGVKVNSSGISGDSFNFDYHDEGHYGGVDVIGVRTAKDKYKVWCVIREFAN
jgi:hypothetical protein